MKCFVQFVVLLHAFLVKQTLFQTIIRNKTFLGQMGQKPYTLRLTLLEKGSNLGAFGINGGFAL